MYIFKDEINLMVSEISQFQNDSTKENAAISNPVNKIKKRKL